MLSRPIRAALFDLDGTLYSSAGILGASYREALDGVLRVPTEEEVLRFVGRPVREIFAALYPDADEATKERAAARVLTVLVEKIRAGGGEVLPGAREALAACAARGVKRGIVTNARREYMEAVIERCGFEVEAAVCDGDDPAAGKGGLAARLLAGWGIPPEEAVLVGDRRGDEEAARSIGCRFVGVAGHGGADEVRDADVLLDDLTEFPAIL